MAGATRSSTPCEDCPLISTTSCDQSKVAHVRLCHSRMLFVRAYPRETQEMVFDAHSRAFAFFKGTCTRGIYDIAATLGALFG
jgi:hypothetical protein